MCGHYSDVLTRPASGGWPPRVLIPFFVNRCFPIIAAVARKRRDCRDHARRSESSDAPPIDFRLDGLRGFDPISDRRQRAEGFRANLKGLLPFPNFGEIEWTTPSPSPARIARGYIIGPKLASVNLAGGISLVVRANLSRASFRQRESVTVMTAPEIWKNIIRPIAVGAMLCPPPDTRCFPCGNRLILIHQKCVSKRRGHGSRRGARPGSNAARSDPGNLRAGGSDYSLIMRRLHARLEARRSGPRW